MMVMGLAPVVGIPLPFMSHGGSSMMTNMICVGTLMAIDRWNRAAAAGGWPDIRRISACKRRDIDANLRRSHDAIGAPRRASPIAGMDA